MLHHYRAQTMPLGRPLRPATAPSPEALGFVTQGDLSGGQVPHPYHQAGQQLVGLFGRKQVRGRRARNLRRWDLFAGKGGMVA